MELRISVARNGAVELFLPLDPRLDPHVVATWVTAVRAGCGEHSPDPVAAYLPEFRLRDDVDSDADSSCAGPDPAPRPDDFRQLGRIRSLPIGASLNNSDAALFQQIAHTANAAAARGSLPADPVEFGRLKALLGARPSAPDPRVAPDHPRRGARMPSFNAPPARAPVPAAAAAAAARQLRPVARMPSFHARDKPDHAATLSIPSVGSLEMHREQRPPRAARLPSTHAAHAATRPDLPHVILDPPLDVVEPADSPVSRDSSHIEYATGGAGIGVDRAGTPALQPSGIPLDPDTWSSLAKRSISTPDMAGVFSPGRLTSKNVRDLSRAANPRALRASRMTQAEEDAELDRAWCDVEYVLTESYRRNSLDDTPRPEKNTSGRLTRRPPLHHKSNHAANQDSSKTTAPTLPTSTTGRVHDNRAASPASSGIPAVAPTKTSPWRVLSTLGSTFARRKTSAHEDEDLHGGTMLATRTETTPAQEMTASGRRRLDFANSGKSVFSRVLNRNSPAGVGAWLEFTSLLPVERTLAELGRFAKMRGFQVWRRPGEDKLRCIRKFSHSQEMHMVMFAEEKLGPAADTTTLVRLRRARGDRNRTEWWRFSHFQRELIDRFETKFSPKRC